MGHIEDQPLRVENSLDLLLVLLYAPGQRDKIAEPIEGITRLQKLIFLLQQGKGPKNLLKIAKKEFKFEAYKMGPYSRSLQDDIDNLLSIGLIQTERLKYLITDDGDTSYNEVELREYEENKKIIESLSYKLTDIGIDAGKELWQSMDEKEREEITKFKAFFGSLSLRQLLILIYEKYPTMTGKSEIREQLGL